MLSLLTSLLLSAIVESSGRSKVMTASPPAVTASSMA
jgi:hypothetical protein